VSDATYESKIFEHLRSVCCSSGLILHQEDPVCEKCKTTVRITNGALWLRKGVPEKSELDYFSGIRTFIRKRSWLFSLAKVIIPVHGSGPRSGSFLREKCEPTSIMIDIGSGNNRVHPMVTNIDILPYEEVDIVADACALPIESGCVDAIVSETALEHIPNSDTALKECSRVLRSGGRIFIVVPFMQPMHAAPMDFKRWTVRGLSEDLDLVGIEVISSGIAAGPASGFAWVLAEFIATILSFGSRRVKGAISLPIQAICSPIKWLDLILSRLPTAEVLASAIWVEGVKR